MVALPALLILWAYYTAMEINLPVPSNQISNYCALVIGLFFVITGMHNLWFYGKGLPMNAFPPKKFVTKGVFSIFQNPIYVGTILISFSFSAIMQSSSGFWLVCPLFTLMIISYTLGFENERNEKVFGQQRYKPMLSLPEASDEPATFKNKIAAFILVYLPWLLVYESFIFIGIPKDAIYTNLPIDSIIPVIEITTILYVSAYFYALLIPFIVNSKKLLRCFIIDVWLATGISATLYFMLPFIVRQTPFTSHSILGDILLLDRAYDGICAAFPAFHVIWAFLAAHYFSMVIKNQKWLWYGLAVSISISCITTGNHSIMDVVAGCSVFIIVKCKIQIWDFIRAQSEHIANSWKEWRFGSIRIINHGFYAGAAGFTGTLLMGSFLGNQYAFVGFLLGIFGIIGAALWAQFIEGSPKLQRPYGYYGSVVGAIIGSLLLFICFRINLYLLLASAAFSSPWIQILGRLRCLVQGCCHGKPSNKGLGIRFTHPNSRVNKISGLHGTTLHPTQLYSIGTNLLAGLILIRLYTLDMTMTFIIGMYVILNGLGRFVEEYYRGEAQTPYWAGMRIYQWIAIINIVIGAIFTCLPSGEMIAFQLNIPSICWAFAMGIFATIAYGVDFPNSNRRFARLTSV